MLIAVIGVPVLQRDKGVVIDVGPAGCPHKPAVAVIYGSSRRAVSKFGPAEVFGRDLAPNGALIHIDRVAPGRGVGPGPGGR